MEYLMAVSVHLQGERFPKMCSLTRADPNRSGRMHPPPQAKHCEATAGRSDRSSEPLDAAHRTVAAAAESREPVATCGGVRMCTTTENVRRLRRVEKCGAVEQASVSRRSDHARASYHGQNNYRAPTCLTRSALGDH